MDSEDSTGLLSEGEWNPRLGNSEDFDCLMDSED